jgi:hypothetical protein
VFSIGNWIYWTLLENVTTNNYDSLTQLHTPKTIVNYSTHNVFSVFTSRCFAAASTADVPLPLGSRTVPRLSYQLLTSHSCNSQLTQQVRVALRLAVYRLILAPSPLRPTTIIVFLLNTCGYSPYVTSSLTRGRVCHLELMLVLAKAVSHGSESRILLSQIRESPNLEGQVPVFISPRNTVARLYPQALGSLFVTSYDSQGYGGGIRTRLHTGVTDPTTQSQSYFTTGGLRPISLSWCQAPWDPRPEIFFPNWTVAVIVLR